jgi:5-hydroxyisourate hydrolase
MRISTHVLDLSTGRPAAEVEVSLERPDGEAWIQMGKADTDEDGRVTQLLPAGMKLEAGTYRLSFAIEAYYQRDGVPSFYPIVQISFQVTDPDQQYHVPLLLSPFGYSTYRGS